MGASMAMNLLAPSVPMPAATTLPGAPATPGLTGSAATAPLSTGAEAAASWPSSFAQMLAEASAPEAAAAAPLVPAAAALPGAGMPPPASVPARAAASTPSPAIPLQSESLLAPPPVGPATSAAPTASAPTASTAPPREMLSPLLSHLQQAMADAQVLLDAGPVPAAPPTTGPASSGPLLPWSGDEGDLFADAVDSDEPTAPADAANMMLADRAADPAAAAALPTAAAVLPPPVPAAPAVVPPPAPPASAASSASAAAAAALPAGLTRQANAVPRATERPTAGGRSDLRAAAAPPGDIANAPAAPDPELPPAEPADASALRETMAAPGSRPTQGAVAGTVPEAVPSIPAAAQPAPVAASAGAAAATAAIGSEDNRRRLAEPVPAPDSVSSHAHGMQAVARSADGQAFATQLRAAFDAPLSAAPGTPQFAPALGVQVSTLVRNGVPEARLHLHPAELGPITVQIALDGQAAQVYMAAEHVLTRQALEQALPQLAGALRDAGFTLAGGGVSQQGSSAQPGGNDDRPRSGAGQPGSGPDAVSLLAHEAPRSSAMAARNGLVDLYA